MTRRCVVVGIQYLIFLVLLISSQGFAQVTIKTLSVGSNPITAATNPVTNKTYVLNRLCDPLPCSVPGTVSVIDGATNTQTATVTVGITPAWIAVNSATNTIYVPNKCGNDA